MSATATTAATPTAAAPTAFGFPVFLEVRGRTAFVAGGGGEAAHKASALAELGAQVRVWAAEHRATGRLTGAAGIELVDGPYRPELLDGALLAVVFTGDRALNRRIAADARSRHVLVNVVDDVSSCDWSAPAILRRGGLTVAVASAGIAPALAVRLRDRFAEEVGPEFADLVEQFGELRPRIVASGRSFADRRALWYALVDGPALDHLRAGRPAAAREVLEAQLDAWLEAGG